MCIFIRGGDVSIKDTLLSFIDWCRRRAKSERYYDEILYRRVFENIRIFLDLRKPRNNKMNIKSNYDLMYIINDMYFSSNIPILPNKSKFLAVDVHSKKVVGMYRVRRYSKNIFFLYSYELPDMYFNIREGV